MSVDPVPTYVPIRADLRPFSESPLPIAAAMVTYNVSNVPDDALAWMLAQGWQISSTSQDNSTTPARTLYNMTRGGMTNSTLLQMLIASYTSAYNEGRINNSNRYIEILTNWTSQVSNTIIELDKMAANNNTFATSQLSSLSSLMSQVDTKILTAYNEVILGKTYLDGLETLMDSVDTRITETDVEIALGKSYIANLGVEETYRINEQFDNLRAKTQLDLVNRGFGSAALLAQSDARVERERSMALTDLADKLAREEAAQSNAAVSSMHGLIGAKMSAQMNRMKLFEEKTRQSNEAVSSQHGLISSQLAADEIRLKVAEQVNAGEQQIYKYMIDTVDALVIGSFAFQERRVDQYPSIEVLSQLCGQLADSGATSWVSP